MARNTGLPGRGSVDVPGGQGVQIGESNVQKNEFFVSGIPAEPDVSIAPPVGQRDDRLPLRGRDDLLTVLTDVSRGSKVRVVHGLGGCGKTRLALEVAFRAQQQGDEVWWVSAADKSRLVAGMHAVGRRLGVRDRELQHGEAADLVWKRLSGTQQNWLLVIDSADDPQILAGPDPGTRVRDGTGWLRPLGSPAGIVVVTSRDGRSRSWGGWCELHRAGMLAPDEAARVLTDHAGGHEGLGNDDEAAALAIRLGRLPLALKIAGSFLAESVVVPTAFASLGVARTYRQYLEAIEEERLETVFPAPVAEGTELTYEQARGLIGRTWELTLDLLEAQRTPEGRQLLRLLSCLADAPIPHELLHPDTLGRSPFFKGISGSRLWQVLKTLEDFALVDLMSGDGDMLSATRLHPLVRDTSRPGTGDPDERDAYLMLAAELLRRAATAEEAGLPEDPAMWPKWQTLVPHARHVFNTLTSGPRYPDVAAEVVASAALMAGRYQQAQGLYPQAEALERAVLKMRLRALGAEHQETLAARHAVAVTMGQRGDHARAEAEFHDVLDARQRVLGAEHQDTLATRHEIALMMAARGNRTRAEAEFRDVLATRLKVLGTDHRDALATRLELARMMGERGDQAGAETEYRGVLAAELQVLGVNHPHTLATRHEIARTMAARGDRAGAEAEFRDVLAVRLRVVGAKHPDTLITRHEVARMMGERGSYAKAEAEFRDVLAIRLKVLGAEHPDTLITRHEIARMMAFQGNYTGAETESRDVLAVRLRMQGAEHPETLITRHEVARMMAERGDYAGAEAEFRDVLAARERVLGAEHPDTLITRHDVARVMAERGDYAGAEAEFRDVLAARERVLGAEHPDTLITRHEVARMMAERGDHAGAEGESRGILAARLKVQGAEHPETLITRHEIARVMAERGDYAGAEAEFRDVLAARERVLGAEHPDTLITRHEIARMMAERGDHAGAEAEFRDVLAARERVLGADHPHTAITVELLWSLEMRKGG